MRYTRFLPLFPDSPHDNPGVPGSQAILTPFDPSCPVGHLTRLDQQRVNDAFAGYLETLADWQWFVTMTFRDPEPNQRNWTQPGFATAKRAWHHFTRHTQTLFGHVRYVTVFEMHRHRDVPHIHALVANIDPTTRRQVHGWAYQEWGINKIEPYLADLGVRHYLGKYLSKEMSHLTIRA